MNSEDRAPNRLGPTLSHGLRRATYFIGTALFLASLVFVGLKLARNWETVRSVDVPHPAWLIISAALYAVSHFSTSLSWPLALRQMGETIGLADGIRIGLIAQIGKYLPGNVAHYIGRGALARSTGVPLTASGISMVVEIVSALGAAIIVIGIMALTTRQPFAVFSNISASTTMVGLLLLSACLSFIVWMSSRGHGVGLFLLPIACLTASLLLSGLSLAALFEAIGQGDAPVMIVVAAVSLAWVAGFLVPGAPAGIGVREAVLIAILSANIGAAAILTGALLHRLITAVVDCAAACIGYAWSSRVALSKK